MTKLLYLYSKTNVHEFQSDSSQSNATLHNFNTKSMQTRRFVFAA